MRTKARECVYKLIFAYLFSGEWDDALRLSLYNEAGLTAEAVAFADQLLSAVKDNFADVREDILSYSTGFIKERLFKADLTALILAVAEWKYVGGVDAPVVIDQAVSLSKKYSAEGGPSFVNGVLAEYMRKNPQKAAD